MQGLFKKYLWLVCQVKEAPNGITYEEINRRWKRNTNLNPMVKIWLSVHFATGWLRCPMNWG